MRLAAYEKIIRRWLVRLVESTLLAVLMINSAFALNPDRKISQYGHRVWRLEDGFPGSTGAVAQTTDGYLWIGTPDGLRRFDGVRFTSLNLPDGQSLPSSVVTALLASKDGSLWIGTLAGLARWKDKRLITYDKVKDDVTSIAEDSTGMVWISRFVTHGLDLAKPLCQISEENVRCLGPKEDIPDLGIPYGVAFDRTGGIWVGGSTKLIHWKNDRSITYTFPDLKSSAMMIGVNGLAVDPDGSVWVGKAPDRPGFPLERVVNGVVKPFDFGKTEPRGLQVAGLYLDHENSLWVGTYDRGIYRIRGSKIDRFAKPDGMAGPVRGFLEDREGTLWVATDTELHSFYDNPVTSFSETEGLSVDEVDGVLAPTDGRILAGTAVGLDVVHPGELPITKAVGFPRAQVGYMMQDKDHRLWIGLNNDLFIQNEGQLTRIRGRDGKPVGLVMGLAEDTAGDVWVDISATPRKLLRIRKDQIQEEFVAPALPASRRVAADSVEGIWLGLLGGDIARYRRGKLELVHFDHKDEEEVTQIMSNPDGSVVGATSYGLIGWRNGLQRILNRRNGLPCDSVNAMIYDGRANLWLYLQCGLVMVTPTQLQTWWLKPDSVLHLRELDSADGVLPGHAPFNGAARSADGHLWFASAGLLQMIDPASLTRSTTPPPVHIEQLVADRKVYDPDKNIHLPALTRDIEIDYTALSFVAPQKVRFRYRLEGKDTDWQEPGTRRQAFYNDLGPGNYRFHVIACNRDGVWNETGASLNFVVPPMFYQRRSVQLLCFAAFLGVLWLLYLLRLRRATAQIRLRLSERLVERERIARELHDTLLQGFQGLMLHFQAVLKQLGNPELARASMEKALTQGDEVMREGRMRVRDLRAEGITEANLAESVAEFGQNLAQVSSTTFALTVLDNQRALNPVAQDEVFWILREAIANAFAHAQSYKVEVEITYGRSKFRARVCDGGCGMAREIMDNGRAGHWGLSTMRERAKKIGADLRIISSTGAGSEIDLSLPVKLAYYDNRSSSRWDRIRRAVTGTRRTP